MFWAIEHIWLIPLLPLMAAGLLAITPGSYRRFSAGLAISSILASGVFSCLAFGGTLRNPEEFFGGGWFSNFFWLQIGPARLRLGWLVDPLAALMLVMVSLVGALIFIYSIGYMAEDENFTRYFCFMSLFAAAMLGLVIANNLLLLFVCWELVGLASYLLIGFWYRKPSAAAAAKKAFITTRIGDLGFFLGMLWLYSETGTLLFYDSGQGCLEASVLNQLATQTIGGGLAISTAISLLIFCGAVGKSGQVPLHVWLPDAMEGPTPVSALIHAATMVAAGVFLVARVYPLMEAGNGTALIVVAWVGAVTALFAASIAVAQSDIKRILAFSTVSQLGYMMVGLGTGGIAVGIFHLITHAFFKALLFLGAGSVILACHHEQDIRRLGGLSKRMPMTFATYAIGMLALAGIPLIFSGFWSKEAILHSAQGWEVSRWPFYLAVVAAFLTAFYMTRQVIYIFFGSYRGVKAVTAGDQGGPDSFHSADGRSDRGPRESPLVMTIPLAILSLFAIGLGWIGTPIWPWFEAYLTGRSAVFEFGKFFEGEILLLLLISSLLVLGGIGVAGWLYGRTPMKQPDEADPLQRLAPDWFAVLRDKFYLDELYSASVVRLNYWCARTSDWIDRRIWNGLARLVSLLIMGLSWLNRLFDEFLIDLGFDEGCRGISKSAKLLAGLQAGQVQSYLRVIGLALAVLLLFLTWGCGT